MIARDSDFKQKAEPFILADVEVGDFFFFFSVPMLITLLKNFSSPHFELFLNEVNLIAEIMKNYNNKMVR